MRHRHSYRQGHVSKGLHIRHTIFIVDKRFDGRIAIFESRSEYYDLTLCKLDDVFLLVNVLILVSKWASYRRGLDIYSDTDSIFLSDNFIRMSERTCNDIVTVRRVKINITYMTELHNHWNRQFLPFKDIFDQL